MVPDQREPLPAFVDHTPPLPATYHDTLEAGVAALGLALDAAARSIIDGHVRLLLAWTRAINLTAVREPAAVATLHVLDSLAAAGRLRSRRVGRLLDLGSGGGFPGIPLAALLPDAEVTLLEAVGKKARFLETVVAATGLAPRVRVVAMRAEALGAAPSTRGAWDVITARAVASTADLVELAFPLLAPGGSLLAWKRGDIAGELATADRAVTALGGGRLELLANGPELPGLAGHVLVVATRAMSGRVPEAYPRDPAARARRPW